MHMTVVMRAGILIPAMFVVFDRLRRASAAARG